MVFTLIPCMYESTATMNATKYGSNLKHRYNLF